MKTNTDYWRDWWNEFAQRSGADYETDRGTSLRIDELEKRATQQFLTSVDPKPSDLVLDAGCGSGVNFSILNGLVAEIIGMDLSVEMIKRAERRIATENINNVRILNGNVMNMAFPNGTFDKVIITSVLQYLNDNECEEALKEMVRVCKDGAIIVIHLKNGSSLYGVSRLMLQFVARLFRRKITPDYYRPRVWYEQTISRLGGRIIGYDSFGIFTLVKLPQSITRRLLRLEMRLKEGSWLKKFGVNYKMTVQVYH